APGSSPGCRARHTGFAPTARRSVPTWLCPAGWGCSSSSFRRSTDRNRRKDRPSCPWPQDRIPGLAWGCPKMKLRSALRTEPHRGLREESRISFEFASLPHDKKVALRQAAASVVPYEHADRRTASDKCKGLLLAYTFHATCAGHLIVLRSACSLLSARSASGVVISSAGMRMPP